jgi:FlaA1/EpsC-like NDP-sugar epimerase
MSNIETTNLIIATLQNLTKKKINECRTFIFKMDKPIKIKDLVTKMIYLSGREPKKLISNKYYGLNKIEKISEKLFDKNDDIKNISNKNIIEVKTRLKKINYSLLTKLINSNLSKIKIKNKLKKYISK